MPRCGVRVPKERNVRHDFDKPLSDSPAMRLLQITHKPDSAR
jgi:hypothetical protein